MRYEDECCSTCSCGTRVCYESWPVNWCGHGNAICEECHPGDCAECSEEIALEDLGADIASSVQVADDGCWEWQGYRLDTGYGFFRSKLVHRQVYERIVGEIPERHVIDHLCRNPSCVNPKHLEAVTSAVNNRRGVGENMQARHANACRKGHAYTFENTYFTSRGTRSCRACHAESERKRRARKAVERAALRAEAS